MLGAEVSVYRNDALTPLEARALQPTHLCISPGPGTPYDAGVSMDMIRAFAGSIPVLGVCLGHQSIVEVFGGQVVRAARLMHGKTSLVRHDGSALFAGLPQPCEVGRYHSLIAAPEALPAVLAVSARTAEGEIMGVRHRTLAVEGVQFHPESILTPTGPRLMGNFLRYCAHPGAERPVTAPRELLQQLFERRDLTQAQAEELLAHLTGAELAPAMAGALLAALARQGRGGGRGARLRARHAPPGAPSRHSRRSARDRHRRHRRRCLREPQHLHRHGAARRRLRPGR